ncbi:conserved protein of unknown function [Candidatus Promineifilum breve]|uniref:DUF2281 domain-containing protein n=1 Tax=Candidatus Promineifilum breve TaxID=1806508 RepID=A0A160T2I9_9CHLR|nr:DUF2281 domain-containing protein [Candidatus Promineifilum breve]CUS03812.2 conserved protein of unknown function [Candidatus Promineifilum breve]
METQTLPELVKQLSPDAQEVVRELVEFLLSSPRPNVRPEGQRLLRQDWGGALRTYRQQYTSLELQHRASDWRVTP